MKKITLLIALFVIPFSNIIAQWNLDLTENTSVSSFISTGMKQNITTPDGKTYIVYSSLTTNYEQDRLYFQILDNNGEKLLGDNGILLGDATTSWSTNNLFLRKDSRGDFYVSYYFSNGETKVYKISNSGENLIPGGVLIHNGAIYDMVLTNNDEIILITSNQIRKYSSEIDLVWTRDLSGLTEFSTDEIVAAEIKADDSGNFYALMGIGMMSIGNIVGCYYFLQRYNASGEPLWDSLLLIDNVNNMPSSWLVPANLEIVNNDAIVTVDLAINYDETRIFGQRFSSIDGTRIWNDSLVELFITNELAYSFNIETLLSESENQLYLVWTRGKLIMTSWGPERRNISALVFQRVDLSTGSLFNTNAGSLLIPNSPNLPINHTIDMCNEEIILDCIYGIVNANNSTSVVDTVVKLLKINEIGEVLETIPVKTLGTTVPLNYFHEKSFMIDDAGQAVVVFSDNRLSSSDDPMLYAQNVTVCQKENTNGIEEQNGLQYTVYPNPVNEILYFKLNESISNVEVTTLDGKLLLIQKVEGNTSQIDVSNFVDGIYLYTITHHSGVQSKGKFVKE